MKKLTQEQANEVVRLHGMWLREEEGGVRADFSECDLHGINLQDADLQDADLRGANLERANLQDADLRGADLQDAYLRGANLVGADLRGAYLRGANLERADLQDTYLRGANLERANLQDADLERANLQGADLERANLQDANLRDADLRGANLERANLEDADLQDTYLQDANLERANLRGAKNIPQHVIDQTNVIPEGVVMGYKKAYTKNGSVIVTLEIGADVKRSNATSQKCRAASAVVKDIKGMGWEYNGEPVYSGHDWSFTYPEVGGTVVPDGYDEDRFAECSKGIHFFLAREEAEEW